MVVGFSITIRAYPHWCCGFESRSGRGVQHYVIKFVNDLRHVVGFLRVLQSPPPIKLKILSKVALNTIKQTKQILYYDKVCEFEFRLWRGVPDTTLYDKVYQWPATGRWFSSGNPVSYTNKPDPHDITAILLKEALNTTILTLSW